MALAPRVGGPGGPAAGRPRGRHRGALRGLPRRPRPVGHQPVLPVVSGALAARRAAPARLPPSRSRETGPKKKATFIRARLWKATGKAKSEQLKCASQCWRDPRGLALTATRVRSDLGRGGARPIPVHADVYTVRARPQEALARNPHKKSAAAGNPLKKSNPASPRAMCTLRETAEHPARSGGKPLRSARSEEAQDTLTKSRWLLDARPIRILSMHRRPPTRGRGSSRRGSTCGPGAASWPARRSGARRPP
mmetsp:Transcript_99589/g.278243  ORF Transcript_99589/g.278243 Transcript_99589/m.278243 type:complete len:251 (-) Transcript_99589:2451-3203(-)